MTYIKRKGTMHKEIKEIIRLLEDRGYTCQVEKGGHVIVRNSDGKRVYSLPSTPGRGRWRDNLLAQLRRRGLL